jgi:hypothetical protein
VPNTRTHAGSLSIDLGTRLFLRRSLIAVRGSLTRLPEHKCGMHPRAGKGSLVVGRTAPGSSSFPTSRE